MWIDQAHIIMLLLGRNFRCEGGGDWVLSTKEAHFREDSEGLYAVHTGALIVGATRYRTVHMIGVSMKRSRILRRSWDTYTEHVGCSRRLSIGSSAQGTHDR